jgi:hypothetical protein
MPPQKMPQPPQFVGSVVVSTQKLLQSVNPVQSSTHTPPWQFDEPAQTLPQAPQLLLSFEKSLQPSMQQPGFVPAAQTVPQVPQLKVSLARSTQLLLQQPGSPPAQVIPQPPQLFGSVVVSTH